MDVSDFFKKRQQESLKQTSKYYVEEEAFEWEQVEGTKNGLKKLKDTYFPMWVRNISICKQIDIRPDDTFVITYPKSGTTWVQEISWLILHDLNFKEAKEKNYLDRMPFIEHIGSNAALDDYEPPRILKSHLPLEFLPDKIKTMPKIVYVVRNPKDVVTSYYNFVRSHNKSVYIGTFENFVNLFLDGKFCFGAWYDHVNTYTELENVYIVHYENLLQNPMKEIGSLATFLGKRLTEQETRSIISFTAFENMKSYINFKPYIDLNMFDKNMNFFRSGKIGDWKNYFTQELSEKMDNWIKEKLKYKNADKIIYET